MGGAGVIVVDVEPDTPEWLAERRSSVGASEAATLVQASHFGDTPLMLYLDKLGRKTDTFPAEKSYTTHAIEPLIAGWVERFNPEVGKVGPGFMARRADAPWLHATFDRIVTDPDGRRVPLQLKTASEFTRRDWEHGPITQYVIQEDVECFVLDAPYALLVVLFGLQEYRMYRLVPDPERQAAVSEAARVFMEAVRDRRPPSATIDDDLAALYPAVEGEVKRATLDVVDAIEMRQEAQIQKRQQAAEYDEQIAQATFEIESFMQTATHLVTPDGRELLHTWKSNKNGDRRHYTPAARDRKKTNGTDNS